jgi:membrane protease YdiL (CAAX protease family)
MNSESGRRIEENSENKLVWNPRHAWLCALGLIALDVGIDFGLRAAFQTSEGFANWLKSHQYSVQNALTIFQAGMWLLIARRLSRNQSIRCFIQNAGLRHGPDLLGWGGAWVAIGIGMLDHYGVVKGWTSPNQVTRSFFYHSGKALEIYIFFAILVAPFYEEVVLRGFLYQAFRGGYGRLNSTLLVICVTSYFHWSAISNSLYTPMCLISLWILVCILREWTTSVWNCVLCHAAYNAAGTVTWQIYVVSMMLLLPYCAYRTRSTKMSKGNPIGVSGQ